jgi:hypothetical protein
LSYDFDTRASVCDHQSLDRYIVDPDDFVSLRWKGDTSYYMRAPINGLSKVQVFISGVLISPTDPNYGYQFVRDLTRTQESGELFYKIVFNKSQRFVTPLIEVQYFTRQTYCLKCINVGRVNDFKPISSGSIAPIDGNQKLLLRSMKWVLTSVCQFYPSFTCPIKTYIGRKFGLAITDSDIQNSAYTALQNMKTVQVAQATVQTLTPTEVLQSISGVTATTDSATPTLVNISIGIVPNAGNPMNSNFSIRTAS